MEEDRAADIVFTASGWEEIVYTRTFTIDPESSTEPTQSDAKYDAVSLISGSGKVKWANEVRQLRPGESIIVPSDETYQVSSGSEGQLKYQVFGVENSRKAN